MNPIWNPVYPSCRRCGTTEKPHFGGGYCKECHRLEINTPHAYIARVQPFDYLYESLFAVYAAPVGGTYQLTRVYSDEDAANCESARINTGGIPDFPALLPVALGAWVEVATVFNAEGNPLWQYSTYVGRVITINGTHTKAMVKPKNGITNFRDGIPPYMEEIFACRVIEF